MAPPYSQFCCVGIKKEGRKPEGVSIEIPSMEVNEMIRWAIGFFVIALIAAVLGFGGIAVAAAGIAKIIFYIFLVLFVVSLIGHLASRT
jgi:uncharacterized membrane protein YtjA (UPF0391 family)